MSLLDWGIEAVERGLLPDGLTRRAVRGMCANRLHSAADGRPHGDPSLLQKAMREGPIAPEPRRANEQHYELPPEFFSLVLGHRLKYSCCYWSSGATSLDEAEVAALEITCRRAGLVDGQQILELGCGWGSLSLWMAEHYPRSQITAVSNSSTQRLFIEAAAAARRLDNLRVITADMNDLCTSPAPDFAGRFDRVVSVEMFEHMRNYSRLLQAISTWLKPDGALFVHLFCHKRLAYFFESQGSANWMGRYFFTGGLMPSAELLRRFADHLVVSEQWAWNGRHYQSTAEAWLANLDANRDRLLPILAATYGGDSVRRWLLRWRLFFIAVAELFGYDQGDQWYVSHYLMHQAR